MRGVRGFVLGGSPAGEGEWEVGEQGLLSLFLSCVTVCVMALSVSSPSHLGPVSLHS